MGHIVDTSITYKQLKQFYSEYFGLSNLNVSSEERLAILSLVSYTVQKLKAKKPDVTYYSVLKKLAPSAMPEDYLYGLAIICEDFAYDCKEFPTFDLKGNEIIKKIKDILSNYIPF